MPALGGSSLTSHRSVPVQEPERISPDPPRLLVWTSAAVVLVGLGLVVVGALRTGISWDEPYHVMRLRNFLEHGWYAVDWSVADGGAVDGESNTLVYGPVTMLLLHGLAVVLGVEGWGSVATTPEAYAVRHLGVVVIALVGTAAAAAATHVLTGSRRWALVTAAALLSLPMWAGHAMFNVKDVPVATGYSLVTLALVAVVRPAHGHRAARVACLASGTVLVVGTRPAMAGAVVCGAAVLVVGLAARHRREPGATRPAVVELLAGLGLGAVVLVAVYPALFAHPAQLLGSAERSTEFRDGDVGRLYVPAHLLSQFPLLLQAAFVLGLVCVVLPALGRWRVEPDRAVRWALVLAQVAALPLYAVLSSAELYNGLRQLLFLTPAWAVVVTAGLARAVLWSRAAPGRRPALVTAGCALALVAPVASQATLFPYQYAYWNLTVDAAGEHVPSDYWRTSIPELLPAIPTDGQVVCSPTRYTIDGAPAGSPGARGVAADELVAGRFSIDSSQDCRTDPLGPLATPWAAQGLPVADALPADAFYVVVDRDHAVPRNCAQLAAVDRRRNLREVSMTYVARCTLEPPVLDRPVDFTRPPGDVMAPARWAYAVEGWVQRGSTTGLETTGDDARLALTLPPGCDGCSLVLDADAPADLRATVDDRPVAVDVGAGAVTVPLDPGRTDAWVRFTRTSGAPLGLRVRSIRVVPPGPVEEPR